jgi:hypothetical protein
MAFVAYGFLGHITIADNNAKQTTKTYLLRSADASEAATDIVAIKDALVACIDGVVLGYGVMQRWTNDAVTFPASGILVTDQALVDVAIEDEPLKTATFSLPTPKPSMFNGTIGDPAKIVNVGSSNTALVTYANLFKSTGKAFISDGENLDYMKKGRRVSRKSSGVTGL